MNCPCDACVADVHALRFGHHIRHDDEMPALRFRSSQRRVNRGSARGVNYAFAVAAKLLIVN